jgi:hypothetical protein
VLVPTLIAITRSGLLVMVCRSHPDDHLHGSSTAIIDGACPVSCRGMYQHSETVWTGIKFPRLDLRAGAVIDGQHRAFAGINGADAPPGLARNGSWGRLPALWQRERPELGVPPSQLLVVGFELKDNFNSGLGIQGGGGRVSRVKHASQWQICAGSGRGVRRTPRPCRRDHRGWRGRPSTTRGSFSLLATRAARSSHAGSGDERASRTRRWAGNGELTRALCGKGSVTIRIVRWSGCSRWARWL